MFSIDKIMDCKRKYQAINSAEGGIYLYFVKKSKFSLNQFKER
jgi:hypothetical protein